MKKKNVNKRVTMTTRAAEADLMGRIMAPSFAKQMQALAEEQRRMEIESIPEDLKTLISDIALRFSTLIRSGPTLEFNRAQDALMFACDLYNWYLRWLIQNQASSTPK